DTEEIAAVADGKTDRRVEALLRRNRRPQGADILGQVGNPHGTVAGPDAAGQADAWCKGPLPGHFHKLRNIYHRCMPDFDAAEHLSFPVDGPERADVPPQALRDTLKYFRGGLTE